MLNQHPVAVPLGKVGSSVRCLRDSLELPAAVIPGAVNRSSAVSRIPSHGSLRTNLSPYFCHQVTMESNELGRLSRRRRLWDATRLSRVREQNEDPFLQIAVGDVCHAPRRASIGRRRVPEHLEGARHSVLVASPRQRQRRPCPRVIIDFGHPLERGGSRLDVIKAQVDCTGDADEGVLGPERAARCFCRSLPHRQAKYEPRRVPLVLVVPVLIRIHPRDQESRRPGRDRAASRSRTPLRILRPLSPRARVLLSVRQIQAGRSLFVAGCVAGPGEARRSSCRSTGRSAK